MATSNDGPTRSPGALSTPHSDGWTDLTRGSRLLHWLSESGAHVFAGSTAALVAAAWIAIGFARAFPEWWTTILYSVGTLTTFVMVFVIQHTQARQTSAIQRKLDEIVRSLAGADNAVIAVEEAPDGDLRALAETAFRDRDEATR